MQKLKHLLEIKFPNLENIEFHLPEDQLVELSEQTLNYCRENINLSRFNNVFIYLDKGPGKPNLYTNNDDHKMAFLTIYQKLDVSHQSSNR